jgi:FKBP-type peptidyl-prolyl cis-trans isomerase
VGKVENGIFVSVDYKGTLEDGQVFDSSRLKYKWAQGS